MSSYLAIGSVCWDVIEGDPSPRLGGSVLFSCRVARDAGWEAHLVTSGTESLEAALRDALPGVHLTVQRSEVDTVMAFPRDADRGPGVVPAVADPIQTSMLERADVDLQAVDVVHLAPILGEVSRAVTERVRVARFVGITPQGLLRTRVHDTGALVRLPALDPWWADVVDAAVLSEDEYALVAEPGALESLALAVTRGERGCFGRQHREQVDVAGIGDHEVSPDRTIGAGDVFAAAFFMAVASHLPFGDALDHANRTAAAHVGADA